MSGEALDLGAQALFPNTYRYRFDDPSLYGLSLGEEQTAPSAVRIPWALSQHVRITGGVLPEVQRSLVTIADRIGLDRPFEGFVYASADVNASCAREPDGRVVVMLSSSAVELLSGPELSFVIGHEFAHAVFEHYRYPSPDGSDDDVRLLELVRAAEISADRVGLASCPSLDEALRAILKTASGLSDDHLDVDVSQYLRQGAQLAYEPFDGVLESTHPPLVIRARSIVRFEPILRRGRSGASVREDLDRIDTEIFRDLEVATHGNGGSPVGRDAAFWRVAETICADGALDSRERETLAFVFGSERAAAFAHAMAGQSRQDVAQLIASRREATARMLALAPLGARDTYDRLIERFEGRFASSKNADVSG